MATYYLEPTQFISIVGDQHTCYLCGYAQADLYLVTKKANNNWSYLPIHKNCYLFFINNKITIVPQPQTVLENQTIQTEEEVTPEEPNSQADPFYF